jgi:hypothetical protein
VVPRSLLLLLLAGCATGPESGPPVAVSAAPDGDAIRVQFRRLGGQGTAEHGAHLAAEGGSLSQVLHSPDRRTVSVFWQAPAGTLTCAFPYGGVGRFRAGTPVEGRTVEYVFYAAEGIEVTARVPAGCPMQPSICLHIQLSPDRVPGALVTPDGRHYALAGGRTDRWFALPRDSEGVLAAGDLEFVLNTATDDGHRFIIAIDPDGTPSAVSGFVRNW